MDIEIFRPGTHLAMSGERIAFSPEEVAALAASYDPAAHEAPIVVGHPGIDAPAYGWVKGLKVEGGVVKASLDQVDPAFAELVKAGRYKKISASIWKPDAAGNPKPGAYYLKHVGFLGATAPAVKGLKTVQLAGDEAGTLEFAWEAGRLRMLARVFQGLRDWLIGQAGVEKADELIPGYIIADLNEDAGRAEGAVVQPAYADPATTETVMTATDKAALDARAAELDTRAAKLKDDEAAFAERETKLKDGEAKARRARLENRVEQLIAQGKVLPAEKDRVVALAASIADDATVSFGVGAAAISKPAGEELFGFLDGLPRRVEFQELAGDKGGTVDLADANVLAEKAREVVEAEKAKGRTISYAAAVARVTKAAA